MKQLLLTILFVGTGFVNGFGQKTSSTDSLRIIFLFPKSVIADSTNLNLYVSFKNLTKNDVQIYECLKEGYLDDRFQNLNINLEKFKDGSYKYHAARFYQSAHHFSLVDSLRHYDLPKKSLAPHSVDTLVYNLMDFSHRFEPGQYRFRASLRIKTNRNNTVYDDPEFAKIPPLDTLKYTTSKWFYFSVPKTVYPSQ